MANPTSATGDPRTATPLGGRPPLRRSRARRELGGVAAGIAEHLSLDVRVVRAIFILSTPFGGAGAVAYGFLWVTMPEERDTTARRGPRLPSTFTLALSTVVVLTAVVVLAIATGAGWTVRWDIWLPIAAVAIGVVFAWSHLDDTTRRSGSWAGAARGPVGGRGAAVQAVAGALIAVIGLVLLLTGGRSFGEVVNAMIAGLVVLAGVGVLAAPWLMRLWRGLQEEQGARIRATERADIAAHLHDSVLQTLALIQRRSDAPVEVSRLARAQERELRSWLYGSPGTAADTLAAAMREMAEELEDLLAVPLDVVVTGDRPCEERSRALVAAVREALVNAARHGAAPIAAYVEVGQDAVEAFVRDHGVGFDLDTVPDDRLGIRESIVGRMERVGGYARIRRLDPGTEVHLHLPTAARREPGEPSQPTSGDPPHHADGAV